MGGGALHIQITILTVAGHQAFSISLCGLILTWEDVNSGFIFDLSHLLTVHSLAGDAGELFLN